MFRPVVAIIRSLSFDTLKSTLYNCVLACVMRRSQHEGLFESDISILGVHCLDCFPLTCVVIPDLHWTFSCVCLPCQLCYVPLVLDICCVLYVGSFRGVLQCGLLRRMTETWWWPLPAETCTLFWPRIWYLTKHQLCYWLQPHLIIYITQREWHNSKYGSSVIRNMLKEYFKIFYNFNCTYILYILH